MATTFPLPARLSRGATLRWMRRALWVAGLAGVLILLRLTVLRRAAVPVTVSRAAAGRVEESVSNSRAGTIKSRRRATLSPEVGGRVAELPARKGSRVARGDLLMRVADVDLKAQVVLQQS